MQQNCEKIPFSFVFFWGGNHNHSIHGKPKEKHCRVSTVLLPAVGVGRGKQESPSSQALLGPGAGSSMGTAAAVLKGSQNPDTAF